MQVMAELAAVFHWAPSIMDAMEVKELMEWVKYKPVMPAQ